MQAAIKEFLEYADANGVKRLYEVLPGWLKVNHPNIYSKSKAMKMLSSCLHKNDSAYRALNKQEKAQEKFRRMAAYRRLFREGAGAIPCKHCGMEVTSMYSKAVPPDLRLVAKPHDLYCSRDCSWLSIGRQQKRRETCLARYGVDAVSKTLHWKKKVVLTCQSKYGDGVTNPSQVPEVVDKILSARYGRKQVTVQGVTFTHQGYEDVLIKHLVDRGVKATKLFSSPKDVGFFQYTYCGKQHIYFPDIRFEHKGKVWYAEVKSIATLASTRIIASRVLAKATMMWDRGLRFKVVLCSERRVLAVASTREQLVVLVKKHRRTW